MKKLILLAVMLLPVILTKAQNNEKDEKPDEQIIVNKEYDEDGNLIGYDSTYIHSWSDTTFNFSFDDNLFFDKGFPDLNKFFEEFFNDSIHSEILTPRNFKNSPFNEKDFFNEFEKMFSDSTFFSFPNDSLKNIQKNFVFPDPQIFQDQMNDAFRKQDLQRFKSQEHKDEWEKLMKKHQQELNEFQKKWDKSGEE